MRRLFQTILSNVWCCGYAPLCVWSCDTGIILATAGAVVSILNEVVLPYFPVSQTDSLECVLLPYCVCVCVCTCVCTCVCVHVCVLRILGQRGADRISGCVLTSCLSHLNADRRQNP